MILNESAELKKNSVKINVEGTIDSDRLRAEWAVNNSDYPKISFTKGRKVLRVVPDGNVVCYLLDRNGEPIKTYDSNMTHKSFPEAFSGLMSDADIEREEDADRLVFEEQNCFKFTLTDNGCEKPIANEYDVMYSLAEINPDTVLRLLA